MQETLAKARTNCVEMSAVMAKYNPFAEKAGLRKIAEQPPPKQALAVAEVLGQLDFNLQLLGSERYVLSKLQALSDSDLQKVRDAFCRNNHLQFVKYFSTRRLFG